MYKATQMHKNKSILMIRLKSHVAQMKQKCQKLQIIEK